MSNKKTFLELFRENSMLPHDWEKVFGMLADAIAIAQPDKSRTDITTLLNATTKLEMLWVDFDLRGIFAILDKAVTEKIESEKVLTGILKDIQNSTERIATSLESGVMPTTKKPE